MLYFDPNERKYYISPQSVELAIAEEKAKAVKSMMQKRSERFRTVPNHAETTDRSFPNASESREVRELGHQIRDLQITNKAKDIVIEQMQKEQRRVDVNWADKVGGVLLVAARVKP